MAIFKEIAKADGSGIVEYHRIQNGMIVNMDYNKIANKPTINGVELIGDLKSEDLKIEGGSSSGGGDDVILLNEPTMEEITTMGNSIVYNIIDIDFIEQITQLATKVNNGETIPPIITNLTGMHGFNNGGVIVSNHTVEFKPIQNYLFTTSITKTPLIFIGKVNFWDMLSITGNLNIPYWEVNFTIMPNEEDGSVQLIVTPISEEIASVDYSMEVKEEIEGV